MAKFCHITPIPHLNLVEGAKVHLLLAHLVEQSEQYVSFYKKEKEKGSILILDNSAFEMYKQNRPMYDIDKLITMAEKVSADYVVMSDYPNQLGNDTIKAAQVLAPQLKEKGFGTFFCPQSLIGDKWDLYEGFEWAAESDLIDYIGVSILAVPNAYGVEKNNKLQRFVSRYMFMQDLYNDGVLDRIKANGKKLHMLGMLDGPGEIRLMAPFKNYIDTWDSSAAIWLGLHAGKHFDDSPTGIINGKYEEEVDFNYCNDKNVLTAVINQSIINNYISMYLTREDDDETV
jgi:hypothetical protein